MAKRKRARRSNRTAASGDLTAQRQALLERLQSLDARAKARPGYRSALVLLNSKFRSATPAAKVSLLQAASFMVHVLERLPFA